MDPRPDLAAFLTAERLPEAYRDVIETLWTPLAGRVAALPRPAFIGLCGPQGSGKSTGAAALKLLLEAHGLRVATLSIDDFYLTRAERLALADAVHPLLATRGPPSTHDLALMTATIDRLLAGESVALPAFDKSADDRRPEGEWPRFEGPADIALLEGWCVGARPQPDGSLAEPVNPLEREADPAGIWRRHVNTALATYQPLFDRIDWLIQLLPPSFETVTGWRREQEARLPSRLMTDDQIAVFVQHYERITRWIIAEMPARADAVIRLDADRRPITG
ncbi:kinase [Sphingomonas sp. AOB5]|uniref:kinase n=1 Tax=Sphingomonas sp. AOB5 TaxID=3034017 RepID=UPI0023F61E4D|nr:kinase [Sphingomonas sp. AOB5]MDF7776724.1 kinase [Sphingomonas sp. AOB5]